MSQYLPSDDVPEEEDEETSPESAELTEATQDDDLQTFLDEMEEIESAMQAADIFTKHFVLKDKWAEVTNLIGHMTYEELFAPKFWTLLG